MHRLQKFFITIQNIASKPSRFFSRPFPFDLAFGRAHAEGSGSLEPAVFDPEAPFGSSSWPRADPKGAR